VQFAKGMRLLSGRCAVVLACGDFSADREMRAKPFGSAEAALLLLIPHATGDGQRMGVEVGGHLVVRPD
jgi:hypothetical protein